MVVAAFDHVDGVDLHVAEMFDRCRGRLRSVAERRGVEALGVEPDAAAFGLGQETGFSSRGIETQCIRFARMRGSRNGHGPARNFNASPQCLARRNAAGRDRGIAGGLARSDAWHR